jgi:hypothetical protein
MRFEQQIFRRVSGDCEFGKGDYIGSGFASAVEAVEHDFDIAIEVADRRVDLRESYSDRTHDGIIARRVKRATSLIDFDRIDYADYRGIDGAVLAAEGHARRASLHYQHPLLNARAYGIDGDEVSFFIAAFHVYESRDEELSPHQSLVLPRGHYCSYDSG